MTHARRTTTVLGGLLTAAAVMIASPGLADAATASATDTGSITAQRLDADRDKSASDGDGQANARAKASRQGRLVVSGKTEGGGTGGLGNPDTTANARAEVTGRSSAADGTYRITVKYDNVKGVDRDRNDGDADVKLRTRVQFQGPGAQGQTLRRTTELTGQARDRTVTLTYKVPNGESGRIIVDSLLKGSSSAPSQNDTGLFTGSVQGVDIKVKRIGG